MRPALLKREFLGKGLDSYFSLIFTTVALHSIVSYENTSRIRQITKV